MKQDLEALLQKQMDRKDFIKHLAIGLASLTGVTALLKTLSGLGSSDKAGGTYGSSTYGKAPRS